MAFRALPGRFVLARNEPAGIAVESFRDSPVLGQCLLREAFTES